MLKLLDEKEYTKIWDKVYDKLKFSPSYDYKGHSFNISLPFEINGKYAVYAVQNMSDEQIDVLEKTMDNVLIKITQTGHKIYALDWHHSAFLYDPKEISQIREKDFTAYKDDYSLPGYYPDGDYYFLIEENFEFGYLGHPWRQEIWVFGSELINEIGKYYKSFGWDKLK